ncbi:MAG TPA: hypothetical protein VGE90_05335 [Chitinophaga sp.]
MSSRPLLNKVPRHRWQALRPYLASCMLALAILFLNSISSSVNGQSANLDQGANEKVTTPISPVSWINGNLNSNQAHFLEGYSIPYRAILSDLVAGKTYTLVIGFDQRDGSKHALDYITHFQRMESHVIFGHPAETVDPLLDIAGFPVAYFTTTDVFQIPAPDVTGSPVSGQPATSFNALPAGEQLMTGYNMDLLNVVYSSSGSLTDAHAETVINVTFTAQKETAVLAWGGHIASQPDWGKGEAASAISGSPYHMRLKKWIIDGADVSIGNQDRSLKTDAVFIPPKCDVTGPHNGCVESSSLAFTATVDNADGLTYLWSIIGDNTAQAGIVDNTVANIQVVPIGSAFLAGSFNLQLIVTRDGLKDTCYLDSHTTPGVNVVITDVNVNAGSDQEIDHLGTANLNAVASGGTEPYGYKWNPVTGLSDPNTANPVFTPPGAGVFQFIVTATDANGCVGVDTVVINVKEHPKPPCGITGPDPVCPGSTNTYKGPAPADVGSYLWSVTGDASIVGPADRDSVVIKADNRCGSYTIKVVVTTPDGKVKDSCFKAVQIKDEIKPILHGTANDANVTCAKNVPAAPAITATDNCQPEIRVKFSQVTEDSTCVNKFRIVRKWWATDVCDNVSDTLRQTITVNDNIAPTVTYKPADKTVTCGNDRSFGVPTFADNCGCTPKVTYEDRQSGYTCPITYTRTWTATDDCGNYVTTQQSVTVGCCDKFCTLTQGFYGNVNGLACTPGGGKVTAVQIMTPAVDAQDGDSVIFGLKATGKFFTLFLSDVTNGNIFKMMPGGVTPAALKGYATYSKTATWPNVPVSVKSTNYGKIDNNLLAQTMTMFFNMNLSPSLGNMPISNDTLFTSKLPTCGSSIPSNTIDKYILARSVVTYLQNTGQASVQGLFNLANKYLGGQTVSGVSASDVSQSIDAINRGFDQCAVLFRWGASSYAPLVQTGASMNADVTVYKQTVTNESGELKVNVFPNPYTDKLIFRFTAPLSGRTILEMFNVQGQRLDAVDKGMVDKGTTHTIEYEVKEAFRGPLIYKLNVGPLNASGKVISIK